MAVAAENLIQVVEAIKKSQKILILPSSPPDGDSIGSALALYLVFRKLGKEPTVAISEDIPESYQFLPKTDEVHHEVAGMKDFIITLDCKDAEVDTIKYEVEDTKVNIIVTPKVGHFKKEAVEFKNGTEQYDLIITVDAGDIHQLRDIYEDNKEMFNNITTINIDHHSSNSEFGAINYVDTECSATTQVLMPIIDALNDTGSEIIDKDIATLLLTGLITDTGSFQHSNTTPKAFDDASRLLDLGAEQQEIIKKIYKTKSLSTLKLWGRVLSKIQFDEEHKLVWSTITNKDLLETNSTTEESNGIIDELMTNAPGAELIILLKQKSENLVSASIRTNSDAVDGSAFAAKFGGGGHVRAAGFRVKGTMEEAENQVITAAKEFQSSRLKLQPGIAPTMYEVVEKAVSKAAETVEVEAKKEPVTVEQVAKIDEGRVDQLTKDFFKKEVDEVSAAMTAPTANPPAVQASVPPAPMAPSVPPAPQPTPIQPIAPMPIQQVTPPAPVPHMAQPVMPQAPMAPPVPTQVTPPPIPPPPFPPL